jgi:hypothetical protein
VPPEHVVIEKHLLVVIEPIQVAALGGDHVERCSTFQPSGRRR